MLWLLLELDDRLLSDVDELLELLWLDVLLLDDDELLCEERELDEDDLLLLLDELEELSSHHNMIFLLQNHLPVVNESIQVHRCLWRDRDLHSGQQSNLLAAGE